MLSNTNLMEFLRKKRSLIRLGFLAVTFCTLFAVYNIDKVKPHLLKEKEGVNTLQTLLSDVLFTVKTCKKNHGTKLEIILNTWFKHISRDQIYFVTDENDEEYQRKSGGRMHNTSCGKTHERKDLCCKTGEEFDLFLPYANKKWWCRFDDDNYVNVDHLLEVLNQYRANDFIYLGRKSVPFHKRWTNKGYQKYEFAHGGAGLCITRTLWQRMNPICGNGTFVNACENLASNTDDCTLGYVITYMLKVPFVESFRFHSHREKLETLNESDWMNAATLSYAYKNTLQLPPSNNTFKFQKDRSRMLSVHCWLHPKDPICQSLRD